MKPNQILLVALLCLASAGCGTQVALSGQAYEEYQKSIKPYIAYWEKHGMTEEGRRADSWACGAARTIHAADNVVFPPEAEKAERRPDEKNEMAAFWRLRNKWNQCMEGKGYIYRKQP